MKRTKVVLLMAAMLTLSSLALADNAGATFQNTGGTLTEMTGTTGYYLSVPMSQLTTVTGIQGFDCGDGGPACHGTVSYQTGMTAGFNQSLINNINGPATNLGAGGSFTIHETENGKSLVFSGTFTSDTWTFVGKVSTGDYQWELTGTVSGTLTIGKGAPIPYSGVTIQLTTCATKTCTGGKDPFTKPGGHISLNGGTTGFPSAVTPESGTLVLFGTGLMGIILVARRRFAAHV